MRSLTLLLVAFCAGSCAAPSAPVAIDPAERAAEPAAAPPAPKPSPGAEFGGERFGFVEASSLNGRIVVLRRFSGADPPRFVGPHGEVHGSTDLALFDTSAKTERALERLIAIDARRRWLLVRASTVFLVDSARGELRALPGVDPSGDFNESAR